MSADISNESLKKTKRIKILLLMTTGMSLKRWDEIGQLSRELDIYENLGKRIGNIYVYTFGKNENRFVEKNSYVTICAQKTSFLWDLAIIPGKIIRIFNLFWNIHNIFIHYYFFKTLDIIKTNQFKGSILAVILKRIFKKKLVVRMGYYHGHINGVSFKRRIIERIVFSTADKIIVTDKSAKSFLTNKYDLQPNKVCFIPNYINIERFAPTEEKRTYDILYVGRVTDIKNLHVLIKGISLIKNKKVSLLIIGSGSSIKKIKKLAEFNNVDLTHIPKADNFDLPRYYNMSKLVALLSPYEGNPKILLEAMACGRPVIATDVPGINSIITHRKNGLLCQITPESVADAIRLLWDNPKLAEQLETNGREYITAHNSFDSLMEKECTLYKSLMTQRAKAL